MRIRYYQPADYSQLISLYKQSDQFVVDEVTDSKTHINRKIDIDPRSLLVAEENEELVGSVSVIEDGRIALLFRLVVHPAYPEPEEILGKLIKEAESILKKRGFQEVHTTVPTNNLNALIERNKLGFTQGNTYTWFWKKIS